MSNCYSNSHFSYYCVPVVMYLQCATLCIPCGCGRRTHKLCIIDVVVDVAGKELLCPYGQFKHLAMFFVKPYLFDL